MLRPRDAWKLLGGEGGGLQRLERPARQGRLHVIGCRGPRSLSSSSTTQRLEALIWARRGVASGVSFQREAWDRFEKSEGKHHILTKEARGTRSL